ncbi:hypothetical protein EHS39_20065 [Ensifer sp. MPMI2T]|nr:hypothetical protein EHS39_20065 [Ensifer sp. MPMI2T]
MDAGCQPCINGYGDHRLPNTLRDAFHPAVPSPPSFLCLSQESSSAASAARKTPGIGTIVVPNYRAHDPPDSRQLAQTPARVIHGADAPWLDSCDKHRNEGGRGYRLQG